MRSIYNARNEHRHFFRESINPPRLRLIAVAHVSEFKLNPLSLQVFHLLKVYTFFGDWVDGWIVVGGTRITFRTCVHTTSFILLQLLWSRHCLLYVDRAERSTVVVVVSFVIYVTPEERIHGLLLIIPFLRYLLALLDLKWLVALFQPSFVSAMVVDVCFGLFISVHASRWMAERASGKRPSRSLTDSRKIYHLM